MPDFPPRDEAQKIIKRRESIAQALHGVMASALRNPGNPAAAMDVVLQKFDQQEVLFVAQIIKKRGDSAGQRHRLSAKREAERMYAEYLDRHRRFGGKRSRMSPSEYEKARREHFNLSSRDIIGVELITDAPEYTSFCW